MKKNRLVVLVAVLVLVSALLVAGCGNNGGDAKVPEGISGKYVLSGMEAQGLKVEKEMIASMLGDITFEFDFKEDGKVTGSFAGQAVDGTFTEAADKVIVDIEGQAQDLAKDGDTLILEYEGSKLIFSK